MPCRYSLQLSRKWYPVTNGMPSHLPHLHRTYQPELPSLSPRASSRISQPHRPLSARPSTFPFPLARSATQHPHLIGQDNLPHSTRPDLHHHRLATWLNGCQTPHLPHSLRPHSSTPYRYPGEHDSPIFPTQPDQSSPVHHNPTLYPRADQPEPSFMLRHTSLPHATSIIIFSSNP